MTTEQAPDPNAVPLAIDESDDADATAQDGEAVNSDDTPNEADGDQSTVAQQPITEEAAEAESDES